MKTQILAANDRIKYFFSLLQLALTYAEHPNQPAGTLKRELWRGCQHATFGARLPGWKSINVIGGTLRHPRHCSPNIFG